MKNGKETKDEEKQYRANMESSKVGTKTVRQKCAIEYCEIVDLLV